MQSLPKFLIACPLQIIVTWNPAQLVLLLDSYKGYIMGISFKNMHTFNNDSQLPILTIHINKFWKSVF